MTHWADAALQQVQRLADFGYFGLQNYLFQWTSQDFGRVEVVQTSLELFLSHDPEALAVRHTACTTLALLERGAACVLEVESLYAIVRIIS